MHKYQTLWKGKTLFLLATLGVLVSSCKEQISGVGSTYLHDTVSSGIHTFADSSSFNFQPVVRRTIIASGLNVNLNTSASSLFVGKIASEGLEVWSALKIPILTDSVGQLLADTLILRMRYPYHYGDLSDQMIDFSVYVNNNLTTGTSTLAKSDLQQIVGSFSGTVGKDTVKTMLIALDTTIVNPLLRTSSLSLIIVPNTPMNTVRAFASNENGDNTFSPTMKFIVNGATGISTKNYNPTFDFFVEVSDGTPQPGEFISRGGYAIRERIVVRIDSIRNQLKLNPFVTINSAILQVQSDLKYHSSSNVPLDTVGPSLGYIPNNSVADSGHTFVTYGTSSTTDQSRYGFQIRDLVESALRNGHDSLVLELRSGFAYRTITGSTVDVEDYNINRWSFYGVSYGSSEADKAKRPKLVLTFSYLR